MLSTYYEVLVAMGFFPAGVQDETLKEESYFSHTLAADSAIFRIIIHLHRIKQSDWSIAMQ